MSLRMLLNQPDYDRQIPFTDLAALHNANLRHAPDLQKKHQGVQRKLKTIAKRAKLLPLILLQIASLRSRDEE
jgi:hypothetical protein